MKDSDIFFMDARKLRDIRGLSKLSQKNFGERIFASRAQIRDWEQGLYKIPRMAEENINREFGKSAVGSLQQHERELVASPLDIKLRKLISKFYEQRSVGKQRKLISDIEFLLKVKVDE